MMNKKVLIASDHAGLELKTIVQKTLTEYQWEDLGPFSLERVDYPDFAEKLGIQVAREEHAFGILICGSGIGMCMAANKIEGIRAASAESQEAAKLSRAHNNANVLCLGARLLSQALTLLIIQAWLETPFTNEARHLGRVQKLKNLEKKRNPKS
jgi:ribose 5-phosphate isomerase B